ncbi:hypothetical protein [Streptomyces anulatus]|uniref:hypothetical protein n=1 Tax=Streptomyces anulatus TaxID=1892 RepID=UPI003443027F
MDFHQTLRELWDRTARLEGRSISLRELQRRIRDRTGTEISYTYLGQLRTAPDKPQEKPKQPSPEIKAAIARGLGYEPEVFDEPGKAEQTLRELDEFQALRESGLLKVFRDTRVSMMARGLGGLDELPAAARQEAFRSGLEAMLNAIQQVHGRPTAADQDAS